MSRVQFTIDAVKVGDPVEVRDGRASIRFDDYAEEIQKRSKSLGFPFPQRATRIGIVIVDEG